uniref:Chromosome 19 C10orf90 homolog n=2 Tax=Mastacembelus armatus TaxID=205130 RepID=A0A3Q3SSK1_9TELE
MKTCQTTDQGCPIIKEVPEKQNFPATEGDRPVSWQALRRGWNVNRVSAFPEGSQSNVFPTGTCSDANRKSPLMKTTSLEPHSHTPLHHTSSAESSRPQTLLQRADSTGTYKSHSSLNRTSSVQPIRATALLCNTSCISQPSNIQALAHSSAVTTLIPKNKAGFSSITISSRKINRSASLPGSDTWSHTPSESLSHQPLDPNSRQVKVQRKATIEKVTEQRVMSSPVPGTKSEGTPSASPGLDTVVHRRKATIIKVTEHRESCSPAQIGSRARHPEYRHSYTEGVYNSTWNEDNYLQNTEPSSYHHVDSTKRSDPVAPDTSISDAVKNGGTLHRATLSVFVNNPLAVAAPSPPELSPKAVGHRSDKPHRPLSCFGNEFGDTEPSKENMTRAVAREWSFALPEETSINPVNSDTSFISPGAAVKEAGHVVADNFKPNRGEEERLPPPEVATRRASPCLTLIQAPDPHSHQTPEEVLALNAAAIIANIKLQRQLSKKKTPKGNSEDSTASPEGNTVMTDEENHMKPHQGQNPVQCHKLPPAGFAPLSLDPETSPQTISLQEALKRSRPDFINRSQGRVRELERKAQDRRQLANLVGSQSDAPLRQRRAQSTRSTSLNATVPTDNLLKPRDRAIIGKEMQLTSKRPLAEMKRKTDDEMKREVCLSNRQRVKLFKKKLLDQILQRSMK